MAKSAVDTCEVVLNFTKVNPGSSLKEINEN
ncbi:MAG: hypothetical protein BWY67_00806 [Bacteroidetes bacterium ADurb.Bin397]|jgi:hypothetical protein|nr:MAG: hypothetical protein BWY67_00806 [Bacteroidetes bacterium ADurb.Bin397]